MKYKLLILIFLSSFAVVAQRTIHVYVALCDNKYQGIAPVPEKIGNGQDPTHNLYWGAGYGIKTHFKRSKDWTFIKKVPSEDSTVLDAVLFKHKTKEVYLLAEAYNGKHIQKCTEDFLLAAAGKLKHTVAYEEKCLDFGGKSNLVSYVGHDGLMEFDLDKDFNNKSKTTRDAIILACISKEYFAPYLQKTKAYPLVWTKGLMAPEAYTLKWALDGWVNNETHEQIRERAAQAYHKYQKCGIKAARWLLVSGY